MDTSHGVIYLTDKNLIFSHHLKFPNKKTRFSVTNMLEY